MSYCTLKEAWGENYDSEIKDKLKKNKKRRNKIYNKLDQDIYNSNFKANEDDNRHRFAFSRGMNRLYNHNGPKKRVNLKRIDMPPKNGKEYYYEGQNCFGKQMTNSDYDEIYEDELPEFNDSEENDIIYNDISDEEEENNLDNSDKNINENYQNNDNPLLEKMNKLIEKIDELVLNNNNLSSTGNYNDLFLFIFTGVLLIFVLDTFVKFGQKLK